METSANIIMTDRFSWSRLNRVGRYYFPMMRNQIILYTAIGFTVAFTTRFMPSTPFSGIVVALITLASTLMLWWGSGVFANSSRECDIALPALWSEKFVFILFYTFVAVPVMVCFPQYLVDLVYLIVSPDGTPLFSYADGDLFIAGNAVGISSLDSLIPMSTCLYVVFRSAKSTFARAAVWSILAILFVGIATGAIAAWQVAAVGVERIEDASDQQIHQLIHLDYLTWGLNIFSGLYTLAMIALTGRSIKNMQI